MPEGRAIQLLRNMCPRCGAELRQPLNVHLLHVGVLHPVECQNIPPRGIPCT